MYQLPNYPAREEAFLPVTEMPTAHRTTIDQRGCHCRCDCYCVAVVKDKKTNEQYVANQVTECRSLTEHAINTLNSPVQYALYVAGLVR